VSQFSLYSNQNPSSKRVYPYLLDIQSSLVQTLDTRLVIPLVPKDQYGSELIANLNPVLRVDNREYVVLTQQMAAVSRTVLGACVGEYTAYRQEILSTIDFLITGI